MTKKRTIIKSGLVALTVLSLQMMGLPAAFAADSGANDSAALVGVDAKGDALTSLPIFKDDAVAREHLKSTRLEGYTPVKGLEKSLGLVGHSGLGNSMHGPTYGVRSIIGDDGRNRVTDTTSRPNSAIVLITRNGYQHCTGWMISPNTLLTAGHCLYDGSKWYSGLEFHPGADGDSRPFGTFHAEQRWADNRYLENQSTRYDYGIVRLDSNIGYQTGWFPLEANDYGLDGVDVTVRGYPGDKGPQLWTMTGQVQQTTAYNLCYSLDTVGGQSGSPVFKDDGTAVGIHTNGTGYHGYGNCGEQYNGGTLITSSLLSTIQSVLK